MNLVTINNTKVDLSREWEIPHSTVNGRKITLAGNHEKLKYKCLNGDGPHQESNIDVPVSLEVISYLFECKAVLEDDSLVVFAKPFLEKDFGDRKVSLICGENMLMWDLFYKDSNSSLQVPFKMSTILRFSNETIEKSKEAMKLNLDYQKEFLNNFEIHSVIESSDYLKLLEKRKEIETKQMVDEVRFVAITLSTIGSVFFCPALLIPSVYGLYYEITKKSYIEKLDDKFKEHFYFLTEKLLQDRPFVVDIQPRSVPSQIDERVRISKFMWAVTLITFKGSYDNHAKICIEGLINNKYFCKVADFTGTKVRMKSFVDEKVKFKTRSEIWMRPSERVQKLIEIIKAEKKKKGNIGINFTKLGEKSIIKYDDEWKGGGPNCLDWVRKKLIVPGIHLDESLFEYFAAQSQLYTNPPEYYKDKHVMVLI